MRITYKLANEWPLDCGVAFMKSLYDMKDFDEKLKEFIVKKPVSVNYNGWPGLMLAVTTQQQSHEANILQEKGFIKLIEFVNPAHGYDASEWRGGLILTLWGLKLMTEEFIEIKENHIKATGDEWAILPNPQSSLATTNE